jgi:predicted DNA-binding transcriptional regulator AlpA
MNDILTEAEAAIYIGMSKSFLNQGRSQGHRKNRTKTPPYLKLGKAVRYRRCDLDAWLKENMVYIPDFDEIGE